jgi:hypothetical protein
LASYPIRWRGRSGDGAFCIGAEHECER